MLKSNWIKVLAVLLFGSCFCATATAGDCSNVLKLSVIESGSVQDKKSWDKRAANFCKEYSKSTSKGKSAEGGIGYGDFSLGGSSARSDASSIASKLCKFDDLALLREDAYQTYVRTIAPQAFDSYNHCISNSKGLSVTLTAATEKHTEIRVAFSSTSRNEFAAINVTHSPNVQCDWGTEQKLSMGESKVFSCERSISNTSDSITVNNDNSSAINSYLSIPWTAYKDGVPISLANQYVSSIKEINELKAGLQSAVIAFESDTCPAGYKPYEKAYGRFIRGLDKSGNEGQGQLDPNRVVASLQDDELKAHSHKITKPNNTTGNPNEAKDSSETNNRLRRYWRYISEGETAKTEGKETRPKNVALLYCTPL